MKPKPCGICKKLIKKPEHPRTTYHKGKCKRISLNLKVQRFREKRKKKINP